MLTNTQKVYAKLAKFIKVSGISREEETAQTLSQDAVEMLFQLEEQLRSLVVETTLPLPLVELTFKKPKDKREAVEWLTQAVSLVSIMYADTKRGFTIRVGRPHDNILNTLCEKFDATKTVGKPDYKIKDADKEDSLSQLYEIMAESEAKKPSAAYTELRSKLDESYQDWIFDGDRSIIAISKKLVKASVFRPGKAEVAQRLLTELTSGES